MSDKSVDKGSSIWEKLESKSKDELIVELVYWRNMYGTVRVESHNKRCPWPCVQPLTHEFSGFTFSGELTSDIWAEKVVRYALSKDPTMDPVFLMDYGLDEDQALRAYEKVSKESSLIVKDSSISGGIKGDVV